MSRRALSGPASLKRTTDFGKTLKDLRDAPQRGMSQAALARALERSTSFISLLENGVRQPTFDLISELRRVMRLSAEEEACLLAAAGMPSDPLGLAVRGLAEVITAVAQVDDLERTLVVSDLTAISQAWGDVFAGAESLRQGKLMDAARQFESVERRRILTPALRAFGRMLQADTLIPLGEFERSSQILANIPTNDDCDGTRRPADDDVDESADGPSGISASSTANPWIDTLPPDIIPVFQAELEARKGNVALRKGKLDLARKWYEASKARYLALVLDPTRNQALTNEGLGWSEKRLAQVAMFRGEPAIALRHCATGEAYLKLVPPSRRQKDKVRRLKEIQAWAYNQRGDFDDAIVLHKEARALAQAAGDVIGVMKNWLYEGDDFRGKIEARVEAWITTGGANRISQSAARHVLFAPGGTEPELEDLVNRAKDAYEAAVARCEQMGEQLLYGRALRNLGVMHLYKREFMEAQRCLDAALALEQRIGQQRRLFGVYEALAELDRDEHEYEAARVDYDRALAAINALTGASEAADPSLEQARARIQCARDSLPTGRVVGLGDEEPLDAIADEEPSGTIEARWGALTEELVALVKESIDNSHSVPFAVTDDSSNWLEELRSLEQMEGNRILAQNSLSVALGTMPPTTYHRSQKAEASHAGRREDIRQTLEAGFTYHDLCSRPTIVSRLRDRKTRRITFEQLASAYDYLQRPTTPYTLDASPLALPLAFAVKGATVWIEIPARLAHKWSIQGGEAFEGEAEIGSDEGLYSSTDQWCYRFDGTPENQLATNLERIFASLVLVSQESMREQTRQWIERLLGQPHENRPHPAF